MAVTRQAALAAPGAPRPAPRAPRPACAVEDRLRFTRSHADRSRTQGRRQSDKIWRIDR